MSDYEVLIIGAGPGGYSAAIRAAQLGKKTAVIEKDRIGGVCLNRGCIPTKVFSEAAHLRENIALSESWGLQVKWQGFSFDALNQRKNETVAALTSGVAELLEAHQVEIIEGNASFVNNKTLQVNNSQLTADHIIIATGATPSYLPIIDDLEGESKSLVYDTNAVFEMDSLPDRLLIVGGGVIGIEFAHIFNSLGSEVTLIEILPRLLPFEDETIAQEVHGLLENNGVEIYTGTTIEAINGQDSNQVLLNLYSEQDGRFNIYCDTVLKAAGRTPNISGFGLKNTDIDFESQGIHVDQNTLETSVENVYAIGDVIKGSTQLAHAAYYQGEKVAELLNGEGCNTDSMNHNGIDDNIVPRAIFTSPEIGAVGLTEKEAKEQNLEYKVSQFPLYANGRAATQGKTLGFVKMITDSKYNEILGVHILGNHASELINEAALAIKLECTAEELIDTIHVHPSIGESYREAAMGIFGRSIHYMA